MQLTPSVSGGLRHCCFPEFHPPAVRLPERFRGGCAFGADALPCGLSGGLSRRVRMIEHGRLDPEWIRASNEIVTVQCRKSNSPGARPTQVSRATRLYVIFSHTTPNPVARPSLSVFAYCAANVGSTDWHELSFRRTLTCNPASRAFRNQARYKRSVVPIAEHTLQFRCLQ